MKIRRGALNLGAMKTGKPGAYRRALKLVAAHRAGMVDAFVGSDNQVVFQSVPKQARKARAKRRAQRTARKAERRGRK